MKNQNFKVLSKSELQETVGGGILDLIASCYGRTRVSQPGKKTQWVPTGAKECTVVNKPVTPKIP